MRKRRKNLESSLKMTREDTVEYFKEFMGRLSEFSLCSITYDYELLYFHPLPPLLYWIRLRVIRKVETEIL